MCENCDVNTVEVPVGGGSLISGIATAYSHLSANTYVDDV
ncbi:hypothetical protein SAMN04487948_11523 [Halogranum amylolyticum]|uniref:Uncharacterized protein n=1 Tax=Halogranum amylolyticum TaxID=660520 RepID=A0A1H8VA74_9EURY|nr:hypothetical protein SAMN04487948_11523 [Halogranum amylolyticum]